MKNSKITALVIVVAVVVGALAFYGGQKYGQSTAATSAASSGAARFAGAARSRPATGSGVLNGTVLSKDSQSVTVSLMQGGSQIVFYSPSTTIDKTTLGTINDVATGTRVMVIGTSNSDGSETAQSIQLRAADVGGSGQMGGYNNGTMQPAAAPGSVQ